MLEGFVWLVAQLFHIHFSLAALLILSNDLQGSIVITPEGTVMNYQDMGGGITALFTVLVITGIVWAIIRCGWRSNRPRALLVHFLIVFGLKAALIWSIYFSGNIDPRILAKYSLKPVFFVPDLAALLLAVLVLYLFPGKKRRRTESPEPITTGEPHA